MVILGSHSANLQAASSMKEQTRCMAQKRWCILGIHYLHKPSVSCCMLHAMLHSLKQACSLCSPASAVFLCLGHMERLILQPHEQ